MLSFESGDERGYQEICVALQNDASALLTRQ